MNYSTYADRVATEVREAWNKEWESKTVAKREFEHTLTFQGKTIYCMKGIRQAPFTVTDRTSALIIDCETIEEARVAFGKVQSNMKSKGWKVA